MKSLLARAMALLLLMVAGIGTLPCACAAPPEAAPASSHCGGARDGLRAQAPSCDCACMRAADTATLEARIDPARVAHVGAPLFQVHLRGVPSYVPPARSTGRAPAPSPPLILRI